MSRKRYGRMKTRGIKTPESEVVEEELELKVEAVTETITEPELPEEQNSFESSDNNSSNNVLSSIKKWIDERTEVPEPEIETMDDNQVDHESWGVSHQEETNYEVQNEESNTIREIVEEKNMHSEKTIIAKGVQITGDIKLEGDLEFFGDIKGDIESSGDIMLASGAQMEGILKGRNLEIVSGFVTGNVSLDNDVTIENQSILTGDIHAENLVSSGKIVGNVYVDNKIILNDSSVLEGNVRARELEVKAGAIIQGQIDIEK